MSTATATTIKPLSKTEQFAHFLEDNLSKRDFDQLHILFGLKNTNRITRLLNPETGDLGEFSAEEVGIISRLSNIPPQELISEWGLGYNVMTSREMDGLVESEGLKVGFVHHIS
jgi:hypothetical protein